MSGEFPGFPSLPSVPQSVPLTARSTVTDVSSSGRSAPAPVQSTAGGQLPGSNLEHRNKAPSPRSRLKARTKGDPLLTRLLYGALAWFNNVPLEKGYSQIDWIRKAKATPQPPLRKDITMEEVRKHRTKDDAWMVFRNKVYDMTSYMRFHPGGQDMLMRAAGRDGTALFMKYHPWVNIDALMEKCLIGLLATEPVAAATGTQAQGTTQPGSQGASTQAQGTSQPTQAGTQAQGSAAAATEPSPAQEAGHTQTQSAQPGAQPVPSSSQSHSAGPQPQASPSHPESHTQTLAQQDAQQQHMQQ